MLTLPHWLLVWNLLECAILSNSCTILNCWDPQDRWATQTRACILWTRGLWTHACGLNACGPNACGLNACVAIPAGLSGQCGPSSGPHCLAPSWVLVTHGGGGGGGIPLLRGGTTRSAPFLVLGSRLRGSVARAASVRRHKPSAGQTCARASRAQAWPALARVERRLGLCSRVRGQAHARAWALPTCAGAQAAACV